MRRPGNPTLHLESLLRLVRPLGAPGVPRVPGFVALVALRVPWLVPVRLRWSSSAEGLGLLIARLLEAGPGKSDGDAEQPAVGRDPGAVLESLGEEQGKAIRRGLGYGRTPLECARAVALANRLVGIKARAVRGEDGGALVITPGCDWSRQDWWGPRPCGAFSRYEVGLTRGLNPRVRLRYLSKKTRGDDRCVGSYAWKGEAGW